MDWLPKLYNALKIPLKVLLPAFWLFSGALTLLPNEWLTMLNLLKWKIDNGFVFGLVFLISTCLIVVYIAYFIKEKASDIYTRCTRNRRTMKRLSMMNGTQLAIICNLYKADDNTATLNYNEPLVQALLAQRYIYIGSQQLVSADLFTNVIPVKFVLQPFVCWTLDHYKPIMAKHIRKLENKVTNEKDAAKKARLSEELSNTKRIYEMFYDGGY